MPSAHRTKQSHVALVEGIGHGVDGSRADCSNEDDKRVDLDRHELRQRVLLRERQQPVRSPDTNTEGFFPRLTEDGWETNCVEAKRLAAGAAAKTWRRVALRRLMDMKLERKLVREVR